MYANKARCVFFIFLLFFFKLVQKNKFLYAQDENKETKTNNEEVELDNKNKEIAVENSDESDSNDLNFYGEEINCGENTPFPESAFAAQPNKNLVYLRVDRLGLSSLQECGLFKFSSAFGVRVVADYDVPDDRIIYVTSTLAEFLDIREEGKVKNTKLLETLHDGHAMIILFSDKELMRPLLEIRNRPAELKCFPRAFHISLIDQVLPNEKQEEICPQDYGTKDRTMGLVGDFIISKGFPYAFFNTSLSNGSEERNVDESDISSASAQIKMHFRVATMNKWINTGASQCNSSSCLEIAFQSWALSSSLGADKCWCEVAREWKFCTEDALKSGFPSLHKTISKFYELEDKKYRPDGIYLSKAVVNDPN